MRIKKTQLERFSRRSINLMLEVVAKHETAGYSSPISETIEHSEEVIDLPNESIITCARTIDNIRQHAALTGSKQLLKHCNTLLALTTILFSEIELPATSIHSRALRYGSGPLLWSSGNPRPAQACEIIEQIYILRLSAGLSNTELTAAVTTALRRAKTVSQTQSSSLTGDEAMMAIAGMVI